MVEELYNLINTYFPDAKVELDDIMADRITGSLIWNGFENYSQIERQNMVREKLREKLPQEWQFRLGFILTITPNEHDVMRQVA